jgi:hypothetical protein
LHTFQTLSKQSKSGSAVGSSRLAKEIRGILATYAYHYGIVGGLVHTKQQVGDQLDSRGNGEYALTSFLFVLSSNGKGEIQSLL